ncbi:metallophosphoesterase family protein [Paenibacillus sp. YPG26]|uniref:metallophosphoesterase family protein n=1 Tax=Paenibacillus sp. YPG26 TaxID=2878915 RepID=UPI0020419667|nr:metallophosphoesterase family protein [Paenibacillus sp. YPG26]USB33405.1 metallophosphatase family protein [Paenibacillus sp. YPG26]
MNRIAIISDIHGNIPALQAVLEDIRQRGVSTIYCLGDLIGKGPGGHVAVDVIKASCEQVVRGNWDDFIGKETTNDALKWHQAQLGPERLEYLGTLPFSIEFLMSGRYVRLFHASPRSLYERIQPWDSYESRLSLCEGSELCKDPRAADVIGYGDIHNAYLQHLNGKTLFNTGSVGNPLDLTSASYVILEGEVGSQDAADLNIQFIRVTYDIEAAIQEAVDAGMPLLNEYIQELRTAKYRGITT